MRAPTSLIALAALSILASGGLRAQESEERRNAILKGYAFALVAERHCSIEIDPGRLERMLTSFGKIDSGILNEPGYRARFDSYFELGERHARDNPQATCGLFEEFLGQRGVGLIQPKK